MRAFLICSAMYLITVVSYGQQIGSTQQVNPPRMRYYNLLPTRNWVRVKEVPSFKTKADSLKCVALEVERNQLLSSSFTTSQKLTKEQNQRLNDITKELTNIFNNELAGTYQVFYANPKYYSLDSLLKTKDYASVKQLSISNRNEIPDEVFQCINLEKIEFINTSINKIPSTLNSLSHLNSIEVYNNKPKRSLHLAKNEQVKRLTFRYNTPKSLPRVYKKFKSLETLELPNNGLTSFVNGTKRNKKFNELDLSNNAITLDKNNIAKHKSLKNLVLTRNNINSIPSSIGKLHTLNGLTLAYNSIHSVDPKIGKLQKLEQLSFYKNQLPSIPSGVFALTSLKELDLYYNQIETLPDSITVLQDMSILYLAFNKITSVPDELGKLTHLQEIYLHNNRISSLPESFGNLERAKVVRVNDNYLASLPASFSSLSLLENLDIARNNFNSLGIDLSSFSKLSLLDTSENPWTDKADVDMQLRKLSDRGVVVHNFATGEIPARLKTAD